MKNLSNYTVQELLARFRDSCVAKYESYFIDDHCKYNKLFNFLLAVTRELKRRGVEERRALLTLFADENPQVRLQAAKNVYAVAPIEAKACLEAIAAARLPDQSLSAGMTLNGLEEEPNCLDWI